MSEFNNVSDFIDLDNVEGRRKSELIAFPIILLTAFSGCIGNSLILILFQKLQPLHILPNRILIQMLAVQDILQNIFYDMPITYFLFQGHPFEPSTVLCKLVQTVGAMVFPAGYWCVWAISLLRFCHCRGYSFYFRYRSLLTRFLSVWPWIIGFLLGLPGNFDLIHIRYDSRLYGCLWDPNDKFTIQVIIYIFALHSPIAMTAFFNFVFLCFPTCIPLTREQTNVVRSAVVIVITSVVFQCPFILMMSFPNGSLPPTIYPWITFLALLRSSTNAAVYMWKSKTFRKGLIMLFKRRSFEEINTALKPKRQIRYRRQGFLVRRPLQSFS